MRYLPFLISLGLTIYALFSCIQTPDEEVPYLPKLVWVILIVLVPLAGPIVWLLMARAYRQRLADGGGGGGGGGRGTGGSSGWGARPSGPSPSTGPPRRSAPDDDPEFLAWLDRQQRRRNPGPADGRRENDPGAAPDETGAGDQNEGEARPHDE